MIKKIIISLIVFLSLISIGNSVVYNINNFALNNITLINNYYGLDDSTNSVYDSPKLIGPSEVYRAGSWNFINNPGYFCSVKGYIYIGGVYQSGFAGNTASCLYYPASSEWVCAPLGFGAPESRYTQVTCDTGVLKQIGTITQTLGFTVTEPTSRFIINDTSINETTTNIERYLIYNGNEYKFTNKILDLEVLNNSLVSLKYKFIRGATKGLINTNISIKTFKTPSTVIINNPQNVFNINTPTFNLSSQELIDMSYKINNGVEGLICTSCSNNNFQLPFTTDGDYNLTFISSLFGVKKNTNLNITIDTTNPTINNNIALSYNSQNIDFNSSCNDINLVSCLITINNQTLNLSGFNNINNVGFLPYTITAKDISNNSITSTGTTFLDPIVNIKVFDSVSNTFLTNYNFGGYNSVNGVISFPYSDLGSGNQTLTLSKIGYIPSNYTFSLDSQNLNQTLSFTSSIATLAVNFYDRETHELITGVNNTIFLELISKNGVTATTITGHYNFTNFNFIDETYILLASSEKYYSERIYFDFTNQNQLIVNMYLMKINSSNIGVHNVKVEDKFGLLIPKAFVQLQEWDSTKNAYITVSQLQTDNLGQAVFQIELNKKVYKFIVTKNNLIADTNPTFLQIDGQTTVVTLADIITKEYINIAGVTGILTTIVYNSTHHYAKLVASNTAQTVTTFCLNVFDVKGSSDLSLIKNCNISSGITLTTSPFLTLKPTDTKITATVENSNRVYLLKTIILKGTDSLENALSKYGFSPLIPIILLIGSLALGFTMGNIYIGSLLVIFSLWISNFLTSKYMPVEVAGVLTVILLLIIYGGYKRK